MMLHKIEKALMLEQAVKKLNRVGIISDYIEYASHVNTVRVIGNGLTPV